MDTRYFKLPQAKLEAEQQMQQVRQLHKEELAKEGCNTPTVRKSLAEGHKAAANDLGEQMRMQLYFSHEVRHPGASKRNISTRTGLSLGLMCSCLMGRQVADIVRGT